MAGTGCAVIFLVPQPLHTAQLRSAVSMADASRLHTTSLTNRPSSTAGSGGQFALNARPPNLLPRRERITMRRVYTRKPFAERFWPKVRKTDSCWLWTAYADRDGYGRITRCPGEMTGYAHRLSWELVNGPIPEGMFVLHNCDTPSCVNPAHLRLGTHQDNMADRASRGRIACGEKQGGARLRADQVASIRRLVEVDGWTQVRVAELFGISKSLVSHLVTRRAWKHVV